MVPANLVQAQKSPHNDVFDIFTDLPCGLVDVLGILTDLLCVLVSVLLKRCLSEMLDGW